jgi:hypothetical protein
MATDQEFVRSFKTARFLHASILGGVLICALLLYWAFPRTVTIPEYPVDRSTLTILEITICLLGIFSLVQGYLIPGRMLKRYRTMWANDALRQKYAGGPIRLLLSSGVIRCGLYESIAVYGLILGWFGAGIAITIPFFVVSAVVQIPVFPSEEKWHSQFATINRSLSG